MQYANICICAATNTVIQSPDGQIVTVTDHFEYYILQQDWLSPYVSMGVWLFFKEARSLLLFKVIK